MWRIAIVAPAHLTGDVEVALAEHCETLARLADEAGSWRVEGLAADEPDRAALEVKLALVSAAAGCGGDGAWPLIIEPLPERDWLALNRERFAPFRIGRFYIRGDEADAPAPAGAVDLLIEAATAFGSGRHASTAGCLRALESLRRHRVLRPADIGCGSAILAIASAKRWRVPALASDIDPRSVRTARLNARLNGVGHLVRCVAADGWRSPEITRRAPFDLVLCNILARPLKRMAGDLARHLAPGGIAILSGLLVRDAADVLAAHRAFELRQLRRVEVDGWATLVLRRPFPPPWQGRPAPAAP